MKLEQDVVTVTIIPDSNNALIGKCCFSLVPLIFRRLRIHKKGLIWQEKNLWYGTNGKEVLGVGCFLWNQTKKMKQKSFWLNVICFYESKRGFPLTTSGNDHQNLIDPSILCIDICIWTDTYMRSQNILYISIFTQGES